jgi:hypothetical protein
MPFEVCHACGLDLSRWACALCGGPCQMIDCADCDRHYCHGCYVIHFANHLLHTRMRETLCNAMERDET